MENRFAESVAALKCSDKFCFGVGEIAQYLRSSLGRYGFHFTRMEFADTSEVILYAEDAILSVCLIDKHDHDVLVAAETPCPDGDPTEADRLRLLLCATATRLMCQRLPVQSVFWWHNGNYHITEPGRNFAPLTAEKPRERKARKGLRVALSGLTQATQGTENRLVSALRRHFPTDRDVVLASDSAA